MVKKYCRDLLTQEKCEKIGWNFKRTIFVEGTPEGRVIAGPTEEYPFGGEPLVGEGESRVVTVPRCVWDTRLARCRPHQEFRERVRIAGAPRIGPPVGYSVPVESLREEMLTREAEATARRRAVQEELERRRNV